jgi:uncharacterized protein YqiB (DUF1249 family)
MAARHDQVTRIYDSLLAERGGAGALGVASLAIAHKAAKALASDNDNVAAVVSLLSMLPPPRPPERPPFEVMFVDPPNAALAKLTESQLAALQALLTNSDAAGEAARLAVENDTLQTQLADAQARLTTAEQRVAGVTKRHEDLSETLRTMPKPRRMVSLYMGGPIVDAEAAASGVFTGHAITTAPARSAYNTDIPDGWR